MVNIPGLDGISLGGYVPMIMKIVGYIIFSLLFFGAIFVVYLFSQYKYKITIMQRGGDGSKDGSHGITNIRKDRAREYKDKNGIIKWKFLFSRKTIPPLNYENIYPKKNVYVYQSAPNNFYPFKLSVSNPSASFEPIDHHINLWAGLELRETAQDYQKKTFWDQYGNIAIMMGTVLFCLILVGVTIYFSYQHANGISSSLGGVTEALRNFNTVPGR